MPHLVAEAAALRAEIMVGRADAQVAEENVVQVRIVILAGVDQRVIAKRVQLFDDPAEADDLRPRAEHGGDFHYRSWGLGSRGLLGLGFGVCLIALRTQTSDTRDLSIYRSNSPSLWSTSSSRSLRSLSIWQTCS